MPAPLNGVVEALQLALRLHWGQAEMYDLQATHFGRWGYGKLAVAWAAYAAEERGHIKTLSERLEFFDAAPATDFDHLSWPRHDVEGILDSNYDTDVVAADAEQAGFLLCTTLGDSTSAKIFANLRRGSEDSMANIEAIRLVISQIGLENYLTNQVGDVNAGN
jgi:bacterioferritin (cytochrome b1)